MIRHLNILHQPQLRKHTNHMTGNMIDYGPMNEVNETLKPVVKYWKKRLLVVLSLLLNITLMSYSFPHLRYDAEMSVLEKYNASLKQRICAIQPIPMEMVQPTPIQNKEVKQKEDTKSVNDNIQSELETHPVPLVAIDGTVDAQTAAQIQGVVPIPAKPAFSQSTHN